MEKFISRLDLLSQTKQELKKSTLYEDKDENELVRVVLNLSLAEFLTKNTYSKKEQKQIANAVKKRLKGYPINRLSTFAEFFGWKVYADKNVLFPRSETELLVEKVLQEAEERLDKNNFARPVDICDMCCGSGCIGLSLLKELVCFGNITLCDISKKALKITKKNLKYLNEQLKSDEVSYICEKLHKKVLKNKENLEKFGEDLGRIESLFKNTQPNKDLKTNIVRTDMFSNLKNMKFDVIACNPPYIESEVCKVLSVEVKNFDPRISLDGGSDGLNFYRILAKKGKEHLKKDGKIIMEIGYNQKNDIETIFKNQNFIVQCFKDYAGNDRLLYATLQ